MFMQAHLTALLTVAAGIASAQPPPMDIVDLRLGAPLSVPECASHRVGGMVIYSNLYPWSESGTCYQHDLSQGPGGAKPSDETVGILPQQPPHAINKIKAEIVAGKIEGVILLTTGYVDQQSLYDSLVEKYGKPTSTGHLSLQNRMGASFDSIDAIWQFPDLKVTFSGMANKIDTGVIVARTGAGQAADVARTAHEKAAEPRL